MRIIISNQSEKPIYMQIKEQIEEQILSGEIPEGCVLPSIRKLAGEIMVSVITTTRAYKELEEDGFITSVPGKGSIVLPPDNKFLREQYLIRMEDGMLQAVKAAQKIKLPREAAEDALRKIWAEEEKGEKE